MKNLTTDEIINIVNSINCDNDKCPVTSTKRRKVICRACRLYKNEKCTFNIWEWKGTGATE